MAEKDDITENEAIVEVYMAMQNAPEVYDLFVTRDGEIKANRLAKPMRGVLQVVMAGMHPTAAQQLRLARQFGKNQLFKILKFY